MPTLNFTQGYSAQVDEADLAAVLAVGSWQALVAKGKVYAVHNCKQGSKGKSLLLHRFLLEAPGGLQVDHINGDGLDNRRSNLRLATRSQNQANRKLGKRGMKGVGWHTEKRKWRAYISTRHIGYFDDLGDALAAYDLAAVKLFGEYAQLNGASQ
jgi:hypothetical protein